MGSWYMTQDRVQLPPKGPGFRVLTDTRRDVYYPPYLSPLFDSEHWFWGSYYPLPFNLLHPDVPSPVPPRISVNPVRPVKLHSP